MKLPVTDAGVTLPKVWFGDATEVEVRRENGHVEIDPLVPVESDSKQMESYDAEDPIWQLGKKTCDHGQVKIEPVGTPDDEGAKSNSIPASDPLWTLFAKTTDLNITDASVNLDHYLYGTNE